MPHSPPRPTSSTAALNPLWHETPSAAEFLDPATLPLPKVHRAWERQPKSPFKKGRRVKKVWRRYETIENKIRSQPENGTVRVVKKQCIGAGETVDTREEVEHFDDRRKSSKATRTERKGASPRKRRIPRRRSSGVTVAMPKLDLEQHTFPPQEETSRPRSPVGRTLEEEDEDDDDDNEEAEPSEVLQQSFTTPRRSSRTRDILMGTPRSASFKFGSHTPVTLDDLDTYGNLYKDSDDTNGEASDSEASEVSSEDMLHEHSHISCETTTEQSIPEDGSYVPEGQRSESEDHQEPSLDPSDTSVDGAEDHGECDLEEEVIEPEGLSTIFEEPEGELTMLHCEEDATVTSLGHSFSESEVPVSQLEPEESTLGMSIFNTIIRPTDQTSSSRRQTLEQEVEPSTLGLSLFDTEIQSPSSRTQLGVQDSAQVNEESSLGLSMFDTAIEESVCNEESTQPRPSEQARPSFGAGSFSAKISEEKTQVSALTAQVSSAEEDDQAEQSTLGLSIFDTEDTVTITVVPGADSLKQQAEQPPAEQSSLEIDALNTIISPAEAHDSVPLVANSSKPMEEPEAPESMDMSHSEGSGEAITKLSLIDRFPRILEESDISTIEQAEVASVEGAAEIAPAVEDPTHAPQHIIAIRYESTPEETDTEMQTSIMAGTLEEQTAALDPTNTTLQPTCSEVVVGATSVDGSFNDGNSTILTQLDATETLASEVNDEALTIIGETAGARLADCDEADTTEPITTPTRPLQMPAEETEELVSIELESEGFDDDETTTANIQVSDVMDTSEVSNQTSQIENAIPDIADGLTLQFSRPGSSEPPLLKTPEKTVISRIERLPDEVTMELQEDTAILKDFLSRAAASKANRSATISRRESASNRRDSDAIKHALASPRKVLEDKDPNSPFPEKSLNPSKTAPSSPSAKDLLAQGAEADEDADEEKTQEITVPSTRRSTRSRSSRIPPPSALPAPNRISIRAPSQDPVVPKKSEAQELAQLTRNNTRRNKGTAVSALTRLKKLEIEHALDSPESSTTVNVVQKPGRRIRWDEQLAYFQDADGKSVQLPSALPLTTLLAAEKDILEKSELDMPVVASTSTKRKSRDSLSAGSSTPKARRLRGLGAANGTPAKGLLTPAASLLPDTQDENTLTLSSAAKESLLPAAVPAAKPAKSKRAKARASTTLSDLPLPSSSLPVPEVQTKTLAPAVEPAEVKPKERRSRLAAPKKVVLPGAGVQAKTVAATEEAKGMEATAVRRRGKRAL